MEAEGLIEGEVLPWGTKGKKRQYRVTAEGDRFFLEWMNEPLVYARVRDPAHLRAAYLESATPTAAREFFQRHIAHHTEQMGYWEEELEAIDTVSNPMLQQRLAVTAPAERRKTVAFKRFTYEGLIEQAKGEIAWAQRGLQLLDELHGD